MTLLIDNNQEKYSLDEELETLLKAVLINTMSVLNIDIPMEISLLLTDNTGIRELNLEYRGLDKATDVLSFPMLELASKDKDDLIAILKDNIAPDSKEVVLGDVVISVERALEQAADFGHGIKREIGFLMVHSILHLLGYDHEVDEHQGGRMRALEEEILNNLNLPRE